MNRVARAHTHIRHTDTHTHTTYKYIQTGVWVSHVKISRDDTHQRPACLENGSKQRAYMQIERLIKFFLFSTGTCARGLKTVKTVPCVRVVSIGVITNTAAATAAAHDRQLAASARCLILIIQMNRKKKIMLSTAAKVVYDDLQWFAIRPVKTLPNTKRR